MTKDVYFSLDQDGWGGGFQLSINNETSGYRIGGPKYNGSSTLIKKFTISPRDAKEMDIVDPRDSKIHSDFIRKIEYGSPEDYIEKEDFDDEYI